MTRLSALLLVMFLATLAAYALAAALGLDPGPMPCGTEECG
jgi:hypothetical protein